MLSLPRFKQETIQRTTRDILLFYSRYRSFEAYKCDMIFVVIVIVDNISDNDVYRNKNEHQILTKAHHTRGVAA